MLKIRLLPWLGVALLSACATSTSVVPLLDQVDPPLETVTVQLPPPTATAVTASPLVLELADWIAIEDRDRYVCPNGEAILCDCPSRLARECFCRCL